MTRQDLINKIVRALYRDEDKGCVQAHEIADFIIMGFIQREQYDQAIEALRALVLEEEDEPPGQYYRYYDRWQKTMAKVQHALEISEGIQNVSL